MSEMILRNKGLEVSDQKTTSAFIAFKVEEGMKLSKEDTRKLHRMSAAFKEIEVQNAAENPMIAKIDKAEKAGLIPMVQHSKAKGEHSKSI